MSCNKSRKKRFEHYLFIELTEIKVENRQIRVIFVLPLGLEAVYSLDKNKV